MSGGRCHSSRICVPFATRASGIAIPSRSAARATDMGANATAARIKARTMEFSSTPLELRAILKDILPGAYHSVNVNHPV